MTVADNWNLINSTGTFGSAPERPLVQFLERFKGREPTIRVLDIGPGRSLRHFLLCGRLGFDVWSVDISNAVAANWHADINVFNCDPETFDVVLDIKTLATERNPPYDKIHDWLKPGGWLFAMVPTEDHIAHPKAYPLMGDPRYNFEFMRMADANEIVRLFSIYSSCKMFKYAEAMIGHNTLLFNWCIEAQK